MIEKSSGDQTLFYQYFSKLEKIPNKDTNTYRITIKSIG